MASRLPMRNWNTASASITGTTTELPDYLWGIETKSGHTKPRRYSRLPDYLWGIETPVFRVLVSELCGFQTTYEELKHFALLTVLEWFRFQTTYEELKLSLLSSAHLRTWLPDYLWGIETWSSSSSISATWYRASRLPMRNWNLST